MNYLVALECSKCKKTFSPHEKQTICHECNAPLLPTYDLKKAGNEWKRENLKSRRPDMWRYGELLPVTREENIISLSEGYTPIHQLNRIGDILGLKHLYIKDEGIIPTGSFKARGLAMAISKAKEFGVEKIAMPSAGNAAGALATYGARAGIDIYVFMPVDAPLSCRLESYMAGANVYLVDGLITDAGKIVNDGKEKFGWFDMSTTKEPYRVEGKKTMGFEIAEQFEWELPEVIIYPTGGGTGIIGMWKAFDELLELGWIDGKLPKMVIVQSEGCAPLVKAYQEGRRVSEVWKDVHTLAGGIRVPKAFADFLVLNSVYESGGCAVSISDESIIQCSKELAREGVFVCPEGAATLAGLKKLVGSDFVTQNDQVLLYNTGAGIKYTNTFSEYIDLDLPVINSIGDIEI